MSSPRRRVYPWLKTAGRLLALVMLLAMLHGGELYSWTDNPGGGSGDPVTGYGQATNPVPPSNGRGRR